MPVQLLRKKLYVQLTAAVVQTKWWVTTKLSSTYVFISSGYLEIYVIKSMGQSYIKPTQA